MHFGKMHVMYLRWTTYSCPSCGAQLETRIVTSPRVGVERDECNQCGVYYRTPDLEWYNMTKWQRIGYFISMWTVAWLIFFTVCGLIVSDEEHPWTRLYGLLGIVFCIPIWLLKVVRVRNSLRRCPLKPVPLEHEGN